MVTVSDIVSVGKKIVTVSKKSGNCNYNIAKYYIDESPDGGNINYVVITRKGIEEFITMPTLMIPYRGKVGLHFRKFKSAADAARFINSINNNVMAKMTKKQFGNMGSSIMKEAKKIYNASGKKKKWTNCVKEAGRKFKS